MKTYEMRIPKGYNPRTQMRIGLFAAQLDDQLKRLKKNVQGLTVKQLEWQQRPGMNTIGMLLAHLALAEVWWISIAPSGIPWEPKGKSLMIKTCGFEDDGLPLPSDGRHVKFLRGLTLEKHLATLTKARRLSHRELKKWHDRDLDKLYRLHKRQLSRTWTLYHVLEHFAGHFGQILLLKHMMRDAGVLKTEKK